MQRRMKPQELVPDAEVEHVEKSIAAAEEITGNKLPDPPADWKPSSLSQRSHALVGLSADNMFIPQAAQAAM